MEVMTMTELATVTRDPVVELALRARQSLSAAGPEAAIRRPLADVVRATLDAAGKSCHTRRGYGKAIALFTAYLDAGRGHVAPDEWRPFVRKRVNGHLVDVTADTGRARASFVYSDAPAAVLRLVDAGLLDGFAAHRRAMGDTGNTVATRTAAVRTFLAVALRENVLTRDQAINMGLKPYRTRQERHSKPVSRRLSKAEVRTLLEAVNLETPKGKRDRAVLDLGLYLGLRESEITGLRMTDFQQQDGRWWLTVKGKRGKTRRLKVHDEVYKSLTAWMDVAGLAWHDGRPAFYSVSKGGAVSDRALSPTDVGRLVAAYGAEAGLAPLTGKGRLGAHDLRRTCARNAYDNGASLLLVQRMLGHADPKTTALYIGLDDEDTTTAVDFVRY
jgi:integrase